MKAPCDYCPRQIDPRGMGMHVYTHHRADVVKRFRDHPSVVAFMTISALELAASDKAPKRLGPAPGYIVGLYGAISIAEVAAQQIIGVNNLQDCTVERLEAIRTAHAYCFPGECSDPVLHAAIHELFACIRAIGKFEDEIRCRGINAPVQFARVFEVANI